MEGYIKLHRSILESSIFASQLGMKIWIWSLLKANYSTKHIPIKIGKGETIVKVDRGSFIFGRFKAEEELNIDASTVYKWVKKFESEGMINITSNNHYSIVTICKYDDYQGNDTDSTEDVTANQQPHDSNPTANQQPRSTTKNNKNNKEEEEKKEITSVLNFEEFWSMYKKSSDKEKCIIKYQGVKESDRKLIKQTLPKYLSSITDKKYQKNPLTYLNGKCWNDFIDEPQQDTEKKPTDLCMVSVLNEQTGCWNSERLTIRAYEMNLRMYPDGTKFIKYIDNE